MFRSYVFDLFDLLLCVDTLTASHTQLQTFWSEHNEVSWTGCEVLIVYFNFLRWGMMSARLRSSALYFLPAWLFRTKPEEVATNPYAYVSRTENLSSRPVSGWTAAHSSSRKWVRVSVDRENCRAAAQIRRAVEFWTLSCRSTSSCLTLESLANFAISFFLKLSTHLEAIWSYHLN